MELRCAGIFKVDFSVFVFIQTMAIKFIAPNET
jgi:hypothetical protein